MRTILITASLLMISTTNPFAQEHVVGADFNDYYEWFHRHSQVDKLYTGGSTLYTFSANTIVREAPCLQSEVISKLPLAYPVKNIEYTTDYMPEDEIDGYGDIWFHVSGQSPDGQSFSGYIWGAQIAKAWKKTRLYNNAKSAFMMLGVSSQARTSLTDIKAEIKVVSGHNMLLQTTVPGLCIFEDCASSPLLRVIEHPSFDNVKIVEASAMTLGCFSGVEKTLFYWNGNSLELVYHAEMTTETTFAKNTFVVNQNDQAGTKVMLCAFSHEDNSHNPVWDCRELNAKQAAEESKATAAR